MSKRLQIILNEDAWKAVQAIEEQTNSTFETGNVTYSDVINEMLLNTRVDVKSLQLKHTDLRRSLRVMASKEEIDLEGVIKSLMELKARGIKKLPKNTITSEEVAG